VVLHPTKRNAKVQSSSKRRKKADPEERKRKEFRRFLAGKRKSLPRGLQQINLHAAGADLGSEKHVVAVGPGVDPDGNDVREFSACSDELRHAVVWLKACGVTTIAMESTGVYWIPFYDLLEQAGFDVYLVDARQAKNLPGRKTDLEDAQWIQQLHTYGLLSRAFRADLEARNVRDLMRQRDRLVRERGRQVQQIQKALDQMNIKLHKFISDIQGLTGMAIVRSIVAGERDAAKLAALRHPNCKKSEAEIARSLEGLWNEAYLFELAQALERYDLFGKQILQLDAEWARQIDRVALVAAEEVPKDCKTEKFQHNTPRSFDPRIEAYRLCGVDLAMIPGIDGYSALKLLSELGFTVEAFPTPGRFASWLALCPGNKISGGKVLSSKSKRCQNRVAGILRMCASTLWHCDSWLGAFFRAMKARMGPAKAITATAHRLAKLVWIMLTRKCSYEEAGADVYERKHQQRRKAWILREAAELGFHFVPMRSDTDDCTAR